MTVTLATDLAGPASVSVDGPLDLRTALDLEDLIDLLAPEALDIDVSGVGQVFAAGLEHLSASIRRVRRHGRQVVVTEAPPLLDLLLTVTGVNDLDRDDPRAVRAVA